MKYEEVLPAVLDGKWVRCLDHGEYWYAMGHDGTFYTNNDEPNSRHWTPGLHHYKKDTWEIKPEEIYVWGVSVKDKDQYISYLGQSYMTEFWSKDLPSHNLVKISDNPIFPIDKPKKYKLVPVED